MTLALPDERGYYGRLVARHCDAVVVGSALVNIVSRRTGSAGLVDEVCKKVEQLKQALAGPEVN